MTPTELEHRLTAALAARADQVTAADLRPPAPPTGQRRPNHQRWMLATATLAAAVLSVAVFVVLGRVGETPLRPSHQPPPVTSPTAAATAPPVVPVTPGPYTTAAVPGDLTPTKGPIAGPPDESPEPTRPRLGPGERASASPPGVVSGSPAPTGPTPRTVPPAPATTVPDPEPTAAP